MQSGVQIGGQVSQAVENPHSTLAGHGYSYSEIWSGVADRQSTLFEELEGTLRDRAIDAISQAMRMTLCYFLLLEPLCSLRQFMKWEKPFGYGVAVGG